MEKWISVDDALPDMVGRGDRSESVLILRNFGADSVSAIAVSFRWSESMIMHFNFNDPYSLSDCWNKQESKGYHVTHWMPLPEPPKEIKQ